MKSKVSLSEFLWRSHASSPDEHQKIKLSRKRTTKALIRLRGCAGWSAPLLFAYGINRFCHDGPQMLLANFFGHKTAVTNPTSSHIWFFRDITLKAMTILCQCTYQVGFTLGVCTVVHVTSECSRAHWKSSAILELDRTGLYWIHFHYWTWTGLDSLSLLDLDWTHSRYWTWTGLDWTHFHYWTWTGLDLLSLLDLDWTHFHYWTWTGLTFATGPGLDSLLLQDLDWTGLTLAIGPGLDSISLLDLDSTGLESLSLLDLDWTALTLWNSVTH